MLAFSLSKKPRDDTAEKRFKLYYSYSYVEKVAPKMSIQTVGKIRSLYRFTVSYDTCENSHDLIVGNAVFLLCAVVSADHVAILFNVQNTVEYISSVGRSVKRNIVSVLVSTVAQITEELSQYATCRIDIAIIVLKIVLKECSITSLIT